MLSKPLPQMQQDRLYCPDIYSHIHARYPDISNTEVCVHVLRPKRTTPHENLSDYTRYRRDLGPALLYSQLCRSPN